METPKLIKFTVTISEKVKVESFIGSPVSKVPRTGENPTTMNIFTPADYFMGRQRVTGYNAQQKGYKMHKSPYEKRIKSISQH